MPAFEGRSLNVEVEAAERVAVFFCVPKLIYGFGSQATKRHPARSRTASREEERCASQARSSGSTTPRVTDSSNAREAVTCSCITPQSVATASAHSKKARQSNSKSLMARRVHRQGTSPSH